MKLSLQTLPVSTLIVVLSALSVLSCSTAKAKAVPNGNETDPLAEIGIIDAHTHTYFTGEPEEGSKIPQTREQYFQEWKEANIVGAVAHIGRTGRGDEDLRAQNVVHCAGLDRLVNVKAIEAGLKPGRFGCIKIYLGYVHQFAYDKGYEPAYKLAEKYNVPVVFHTGDTYSVTGKLKYADPLTIDEVAVDHPKVTFVIAHCGNPWIESAAEVAYKNPNVYLDGSAFLVGDLSKYTPAQLEEYVSKPLRWVFGYVDNPSKLMFGTDWPLTHIKPYVEAFKKGIPREAWPAVFHDNAVKVFKLKSR
ncbi:MAG: amidohydrolase [Methylotenera sp.]|nr:amidohydrolase [Oligoflexia bacterium]